MINFLLWAMPLVSVSMMIVPVITLILITVALVANNEKFGIRVAIVLLTFIFIWGLWIGLYHVLPVIQ